MASSGMQRLAKTAPVRKARAALQRVPRALARLAAGPADYAARPPIIVNSLPKSGTHLMMQLADVLPGTVNYGSFIAQHPSLTLRERSQAEIDARIRALAPGEIVGAHLHYSPATAQALADRNALHLFIWRDPRDVILSEAHYLAEMARFHAMHGTFKALPDARARVALAIRGDGTPRYPDARTRFGAYMGWTDPASGAVVFRYETLTDPETQAREIQRLEEAFRARAAAVGAETGPLQARLVSAVDPARSHTFHKGGIARWKSEMSAEHQALCAEAFGDWLAP